MARLDATKLEMNRLDTVKLANDRTPDTNILAKTSRRDTSSLANDKTKHEKYGQ